MMLADFLTALATCAPQYRWHVGEVTGHLRAYRSGHAPCCPFMAVAHAQGSHGVDCAYYVGVSILDGMAVICAADNDRTHDPALRQALLEAVGLGEETTR